jgi:threonine aldolase
MLGGGMRHAGLLAAGALYAWVHNVERLAEDHGRAQQLAAGVEALGLRTDPCETNLLYVHVDNAASVQAALETHDVYGLAVGPSTLRLVTHLDVNDAGVAQTLTAFQRVMDAGT